jgi:hypothetical protein
METATQHCESQVCGEQQHSDEIRGQFMVILSYTQLRVRNSISLTNLASVSTEMRPSFSPHSIPPKIVTKKRAKDVKFTRVTENVIVVASCSVSSAFIPPLLLPRGLKCTNIIYPQELKSH